MVQSLLRRFSLNYSTENIISFFWPLVRIVAILIIALIVLKLVDSALKRVWTGVYTKAGLARRRVEQRTETLRQIVGSLGRIVVWSTAVIMLMHELHLDTSAVLTGAGILGLAVGFGAQSLVKDVISGFFILLEDQYGVGDFIRIGEHEGYVEHMTLRITMLRNFEGHVHVIPNGSVSSVTVTTKDWARAVVQITVPHSVELGRLFTLLDEAGARLSNEYKGRVLESPQILGVDKLSDDGATVGLAVKTLPMDREEISRAWRRLIREVLDGHGIAISSKEKHP